MCVILLFNPISYANACLNAISVWAIKVMPLLFPFFVITKSIVLLSTPKENFMDKFWNKLYHTPNGSFSTFFFATLSGYPVGAKLICEMYDTGKIDINDAKKMLSFCSVSGPMFMLGTVGISMLVSVKAGLIILISNIIASLINGFIYRGKKTHKMKTEYSISHKEFSITDIVYDSLISILMVGAYIALSFIFIELLTNLKIFQGISSIICWVFNLKDKQNVVSSVLKGIIEITGGILDLSNTTIGLNLKIIISSTLIGFGGISIFLQSLNFLSKLKISIKTMFLQKLTQAVLCFIISFLICLICF